MTDPLRQWSSFARAVRDRLDAGRTAYADRSFSLHPAELLTELQQEALDMAGWGFVLFTRLQAAQDALAAAGACSGAPEPPDACEPPQLPDTVAMELTLLIQPHEAGMLLALARDFGWTGDDRTLMRRVIRHAFTRCFELVFKDRVQARTLSEQSCKVRLPELAR